MIRRVLGILLCLWILSGFHWWDPFARWIGLGNKAYESGDFEAAEESFEHAETIAPGDPRALHNLGATAYQRNELENAELQFKKAAEAGDDSVAARAWYDLGCTQLKAGRSVYGIAGWCRTCFTRVGFGSNLSRCPRQRAGLRGSRHLRAAAKSRTFSIRP